MRLRSFYLRLCATFFIVCNAYALPAQDLSNLNKEAEDFLRQELSNQNINRLQVIVAQTDPRLRVAACDRKLTMKNKSRDLSASNMTIQVSCLGSSRWSFYLNAQVKQWVNVAVAGHDLMKGDLLDEHDIAISERELSRTGTGFITDPDNAQGMQIKKNVKKGAPLRYANLTPPTLVKRGDHVTVIAAHGQFSVKIAGIAMTKGKLGEQIKVKNTHSERIISARVTDKGQVEIRL